MKKALLIFGFVFTISNIVMGQTLLSKDEVKTQRFGKDILYKNYDTNILLEGHYKIADNRGNYSDLHFKKGVKDGESTDYDYKGRILKTVMYKNGKAEGKYTTYHQNGKVSKQGYFVDGEEDGEWKVFNNKGDLKTIENYKNGKKHGKWWKKVFYGQFQITTEITEHYKDDMYFGHAEEKHEDGKLKWERNYTNNLSYTHKDYYPNGKLSVVKTFVDGKLHGEKLTYTQDGVLLENMLFKEDQLQKATAFYRNGNKNEVHHFKHGKHDGLFQQFTEKGILIQEGNFKDGYKSGLWKSFSDDDGRLLSETTFSNSVKNGLAKEYNQANRVAKEGNYKNGEKDGVWKTYNLAGKLIKEIEYQLGKEIASKTFN